MGKMKLLLDVVNDLRSLADSVQAVAEAMAGNAAPTEATEATTSEPAPPTTPAIKLEDLRARLGEISRAGHTAEIHDLIGKYGATHLSKVAPEHYADLLKDAEVLMNAT